MFWPPVLSSLGLAVDILGVWILLEHGLPPEFWRRSQGGALLASDPDPEAVKQVERSKKWSKWGFPLIITGFALQLSATLIQVDWPPPLLAWLNPGQVTVCTMLTGLVSARSTTGLSLAGLACDIIGFTIISGELLIKQDDRMMGGIAHVPGTIGFSLIILGFLLQALSQGVSLCQ